MSNVLLNYRKQEQVEARQESCNVLRVSKTGKLRHCATVEVSQEEVIDKLERESKKLNIGVSIIVLDSDTIVLRVEDGGHHLDAVQRHNDEELGCGLLPEYDPLDREWSFDAYRPSLNDQLNDIGD